MSKIHNYEISSSLGKPVIFTHDDEKLFNVLFRRVTRLNQILEMWNFGLCFTDNGQVYWVDLDQHKYSSFNSYPLNDASDIKLTLAVFTYPLSLANEIWSQSASVLFFQDIVKSVENKTVEMTSLEVIIGKYLNGMKSCDIEFNAKSEQYKDKTCFQLIKRYFDFVDKINFELTTGKFKCNDGKVNIIMTNQGLYFKSDFKVENTKYNWKEIHIFKIKGAICNLILQKDGIKSKTHIKLPSFLLAKQFEYVCAKHFCQYSISTNAEKDPEFKILEDLSSKEQKYIEIAVHLQSQLSEINSNNGSMKNENILLKRVNATNENKIEALNNRLNKEEELRKELENKIKIFEMKVSKISEYENEIKRLKKEVNTIENEKTKQTEWFKGEIEKLKKKNKASEDRIKQLSNQPNVERRSFGLNLFKASIPENKEADTKTDHGSPSASISVQESSEETNIN